MLARVDRVHQDEVGDCEQAGVLQRFVFAFGELVRFSEVEVARQTRLALATASIRRY